MQIKIGALTAQDERSESLPWANPGSIVSAELSGDFDGSVAFEAAETHVRTTPATAHRLEPIVFAEIAEPKWEQLSGRNGAPCILYGPGSMASPEAVERKFAVRLRVLELRSGSVAFRLQSSS